MSGYQKKVTTPASMETAMYAQLLIAAGGAAPIMMSRAMPPEFPAAKHSTRTPKKSSLCWKALVAPLSANTNVPVRSNTASSVEIDLIAGDITHDAW
jgi:hypothetical protein